MMQILILHSLSRPIFMIIIIYHNLSNKGSRVSKFHCHRFQAPGPGTYKVSELITYKKSGPSYSISGRYSNETTVDDNPGPNKYYPKLVGFLT